MKCQDSMVEPKNIINSAFGEVSKTELPEEVAVRVRKLVREICSANEGVDLEKEWVTCLILFSNFWL